MKVKTATLAMSVVTILMLNGCGGGEDSSSTPTQSANTSTQTTDTTQEDTAVGGVTQNVEPKASESFGYETQREVQISIAITNTKDDTLQKQILIYESKKVETLYDEIQIDEAGTTERIEIGEREVFDGELLSTSTDENYQLNEKLTLGNHIKSLWIVIPSEQYEKEVSIQNNEISLQLGVNYNKGGL